MRSLFYMLLLTLAACGQKGQLYLPVEMPAGEALEASGPTAQPAEESPGDPTTPEAAVEEEKKDD